MSFSRTAVRGIAGLALILPFTVGTAFADTAGGEDGDTAAETEMPALPATIDSDGDGVADAWDRNSDGSADAWDTNGDGKPDLFDDDGDGKPD